MTRVVSVIQLSDIHELLVLFHRLKSLESSPFLNNVNVYMFLYHKYFTIFAIYSQISTIINICTFLFICINFQRVVCKESNVYFGGLRGRLRCIKCQFISETFSNNFRMLTSLKMCRNMMYSGFPTKTTWNSGNVFLKAGSIKMSVSHGKPLL